MRPDTEPMPEKRCEPMMNCCTSRRSAREELARRAKGLRDKAHDLEKLAEEIGRLSPDADAALFDLVMSMRP